MHLLGTGFLDRAVVSSSLLWLLLSEANPE